MLLNAQTKGHHLYLIFSTEQKNKILILRKIPRKNSKWNCTIIIF